MISAIQVTPSSKGNFRSSNFINLHFSLHMINANEINFEYNFIDSNLGSYSKPFAHIYASNNAKNLNFNHNILQNSKVGAIYSF